VYDISGLLTPLVSNKINSREYQISEDPIGILGTRVLSPAIGMFLFQLFSVVGFSNTYEVHLLDSRAYRDVENPVKRRTFCTTMSTGVLLTRI
jgi:hypothetical protein